MKTLLLTEVFPPQTGGSGRWFWEVYRRLPREAVHIVAGEYDGAEAFDRTHDLNVLRLPLAMPQWGVRSLRGLRGYWGLFRALKRLVRDEAIQAVHAGRVLQEGWLAWMLHKWCGLPYAVYVHGEELNFGRQSRELAWMMRRVFAAAERVVVNSRNTERLMHTEWSVPLQRLTVLHPGVDTQRFRPEGGGQMTEDGGRRTADGESIHPLTPSPPHPLTLLTVGRLQKRKGQDMLIRALPAIREAFPDVRYAIVGDGKEREALQRLVEELGLQEHVEFRGEATDVELAECYRRCDLFALPNREVDGDFEGFGMVLLEAQASGKPVLAGDSGGTAETMQPGKTGLIVDCTRPEPLAEGVIELLADEQRRRRMGAAARRWAVERFDWSALAGQAAELFGLTANENATESAPARAVVEV